MEFSLAARELERANEEIKAAAWDEESLGRTHSVDAALAELSDLSRKVMQDSLKVGLKIRQQPIYDIHVKRTVSTEAATDAAVNAIRQHGLEQSTEKATDAVATAIRQHSHERSLQAATDAVTNAIHQHSHELSMDK